MSRSTRRTAVRFAVVGATTLILGACSQSPTAPVPAPATTVAPASGTSDTTRATPGAIGTVRPLCSGYINPWGC